MLLHSERPKLYSILAFLSAIGLKEPISLCIKLFIIKTDIKLMLNQFISFDNEEFYILYSQTCLKGSRGGQVERRCWVNFQCRGVLLVWMIVWQGPIALAVGAGGGCLDIFSLTHLFSFLSPSLWETARYRLKYCLKGQFICTIFWLKGLRKGGC